MDFTLRLDRQLQHLVILSQLNRTVLIVVHGKMILVVRLVVRTQPNQNVLTVATWKDDSCVTSKAPPPKPTKHHQTKHHHPPGPKYCGMKCTKSKDCPSGCGQCMKGICNTSQSVPCTAGYKLIPLFQ